MTNRKNLIGVLSLVAGLVVASISTPARADGGTCTIANLNTDSSGKVQIKCSQYPNSFSASVGQSCNGNVATADSIKVYWSLAQAALLSGKKLTVISNPACPTYIQYMQLDS
jgi:hypothetical protein